MSDHSDSMDRALDVASKLLGRSMAVAAFPRLQIPIIDYADIMNPEPKPKRISKAVNIRKFIKG